MKKKTIALISMCIGTLSLLIVFLNNSSWPFIISSIIIAVIGLSFGVNQIVLKEQANNRKYYYLILLFGTSFLLLGLLK
jgi:hypothetical protein